MRIITVSRQIGSGGDEIAAQVAAKLGYTLADRQKCMQLLANRGVHEQGLHLLKERPPALVEGDRRNLRVLLGLLQQELESLAKKTPIVLVGLGGAFLFAEQAEAFHVKVVQSRALRIATLEKVNGIDASRASALLSQSDRDRTGFIRFYFGQDAMDVAHYDLTINTDLLGVNAGAEVVVAAIAATANSSREKVIAQRKIAQQRVDSWSKKDSSESAPEDKEPPSFAHPSEIEFSQVLDFYRIPWLYEPHTFALNWDEQGRVREAFTPDFYLPGLDMYIELTTMKQSLVTKKNRKVRKLREMYPHINIKIVYGKDYHRLLRKYGKE